MGSNSLNLIQFITSLPRQSLLDDPTIPARTVSDCVNSTYFSERLNDAVIEETRYLKISINNFLNTVNLRGWTGNKNGNTIREEVANKILESIKSGAVEMFTNNQLYDEQIFCTIMSFVLVLAPEDTIDRLSSLSSYDQMKIFFSQLIINLPSNKKQEQKERWNSLLASCVANLPPAFPFINDFTPFPITAGGGDIPVPVPQPSNTDVEDDLRYEIEDLTKKLKALGIQNQNMSNASKIFLTQKTEATEERDELRKEVSNYYNFVHSSTKLLAEWNMWETTRRMRDTKLSLQHFGSMMLNS